MDIERQGGVGVEQIDRNTPRKVPQLSTSIRASGRHDRANNLGDAGKRSSHGFRERRPA
jgi:hypothetical protein